MKKSSKGVDAAASPGVTLFVVSIVQFFVPFLMSATNVALPVIGHDLRASAVQLGLSQTIMVLATASLLLPAGRFSDIYGRKRVFISGIVILAIATMGLGLAHSIEVFLVFRFIQGLGAAMSMATSIAILSAVYPPEHRGKAMGIIVAMVYIGLASGPSLAGVIVSQLSWRWLFFIVFIMILLALLVTLVRLKGEWRSAGGEPFDYVGSAVFFFSLVLLIYGASHVTGRASAKWFVLCGLMGLGLFGVLEWRSRYPLLDLRLLRDNLSFSFSNVATFLNYASSSSFLFFFSLYLQYVKGLSPQNTGMLLVVQPVIQALLAPVVGRLSDIYPPWRIATIGMGFCTIGLLGGALINPGTSFAFIVVVMILLGVSLGLFSTPNMTAIMNSVGPKHQGTAASMVSTMRTMGMLFSTTTIAVILSIFLGDQAVNPDNLPLFVHSMKTSLFLFSALSLMGTLFSMATGRLSATKPSRAG